MNKQYTSVKCYGNSIWYRGYNKKTRERIQRKFQYCPTLFIESDEPTGYKFITDQSKYAMPINFDCVKDAKDSIYSNKGISNGTSYAGMRAFEYAYISDAKDGNDIDYSLIKIANIDIEVISETESEFPEPDKADQPIVAITVKSKTKFFAFGFKDYTPEFDDEVYIKCQDEEDLLLKFLQFWQKYDPDIVTGWNIQSFDIPYLVNRISNILGSDFAKKLSPWGFIRKFTKKDKFKTYIGYEFVGIETIDYMQLYQKIPHANAQQESYSLAHIAEVELGEAKTDYAEYGSLKNLYLQNFQLFQKYNIQDVRIVDNIEKKKEFIALAVTTTYDAKSMFSDIFTQTVMVDNIIFNHARAKKQVIPAKKENFKNEKFTGAFVYPIKAGKYKWIVTCDLTSLYPHLQMQYNISPDTIQPKHYEYLDVDDVVNNKLNFNIQQKAIKHDCCVAANGHFFTNAFEGLLPEIQKQMFDDRKAYRKIQNETENLLSKTDKNSSEYEQLKTKAIKYKNLQIAKKLQLNSIYGASGSEYFRYYDIRIAEAITKSGQLAIKRIAKRLNEYFRNLTESDLDFIIGGDTDSIFLNIGPVVDLNFSSDEQKDTHKIVDFIDEYFKNTIESFIDECYNELAQEMNCVENKMHMKREKIAEVGIYTAKKRYAILVWDEEGIRYKEPKLAIAGLETQRSSTPKIAKKKLREGILICLKQDEKDIQSFISQFKKDFIGKTFHINDIAGSSTANNVDKYYVSLNEETKKGTPFHIKGVVLHNNLIQKMNLSTKVQKIANGDKIKVLRLSEPNQYQSSVFSYIDTIPPEFNFDYDIIDYREQFEAIFGKPMRTIVETCGWTDIKRKSLI